VAVAKNLVMGENTISLEPSGDGLLDAIAAITGHVDGTKSLTREKLAAAASDFPANAFLLGKAEKYYLASLDLVDAYEENEGPLFINDKTKNGFKAREQ